MTTTLRFASLYAFVYAAFGAEVPFVPSYLLTKGLDATQIGLVLATATITQFLFAPLAGLTADRLGARRVLACAAVAACGSVVLYLAAGGFWSSLAVAIMVAIATTPLSPLADALAVPALAARPGAYSRIRGVGSGGFIAGSLLSGALVERLGIAAIVPVAAVCFAAVIAPLPSLPPAPTASREMVRGALPTLLRSRSYVRVLCVSALVIGSHAMVDAFAVISWRAGAISSQTIGVLLALAVGSELVVFILIGPPLLKRYGVAVCACIGAVAGCGRWAVLAESRTLWLIALSQMLHGLTFALVHLACMRVIAEVVPRRLSGTAQALYGTVSSGLASAAITLAAGGLYAKFHDHAFWMVVGLCLASLPFAAGLSEERAPCSP